MNLHDIHFSPMDGLGISPNSPALGIRPVEGARAT